MTHHALVRYWRDLVPGFVAHGHGVWRLQLVKYLWVSDGDAFDVTGVVVADPAMDTNRVCVSSCRRSKVHSL